LIPPLADLRARSLDWIGSRICIFSQRTNCVKRVNPGRVPREIIDQVITIFHEACYAKYQGKGMVAIEKIRNLLPRLASYLDTDATPLLAPFTEALQGTAFILGFRATSVVESANNMLKNWIPSQIHGLAAMCEEAHSRTQ
jgi:hypothetical protein